MCILCVYESVQHYIKPQRACIASGELYDSTHVKTWELSGWDSITNMYKQHVQTTCTNNMCKQHVG